MKNKKVLSKELLLFYAGYLIASVATLLLLACIYIAVAVPMTVSAQTALIITAFVIFFMSATYAIKIEQVAGYYECKYCQHKHVPKFESVFWAMHIGSTRYMKCQECEKKSWQKKVFE